MNIIELLKKDHEEALQLFDKLESMEEGKSSDIDKLFSNLSQELEIHMSGEESIFYPALKDNDETHTMILEGIEEHHVAKLILKEMSSLKSKDEKWFAKLSVLKENVEHHIEEEEGDLFTKAQNLLESSQLDTMGSEMESMKKEQMASA
ncbi:MAG: hemerythrin domain-containing protein [Nitrospirota bacterium]